MIGDHWCRYCEKTTESCICGGIHTEGTNRKTEGGDSKRRPFFVTKEGREQSFISVTANHNYDCMCEDCKKLQEIEQKKNKSRINF